MVKKISTKLSQYGFAKIIAFVIIIGINLFLHSYRLSSIPHGINVDEMGTGYDAWCIANFGVDRFLKSFPVYFINYCDGQSALYTYLCAILIKFFHMPLNILTIRIPIFFFSCLTLFFGIKIICLKYQNLEPGKRMNFILAFAALYTACPIFTTFHRMAFDCNLMLGLATVFLYTLFVAIEKPSIRHYLISGLTCGLLLYTYALSYFVVPIFLLGMILYIVRLRRINWKQFFSFVIPLAILGLPLVLEQIVNMTDLPELHLGFLTVTKMYRYRGEEFVLSTIFTNALNVFKAVFFNDHLLFDTIPKYGTMYAFSFPFIIIGLVHQIRRAFITIKNKEWDIAFPIVLWTLAELFMGCFLREQPTRVYTLNGAFIGLLLLLLNGITVSYEWIRKYSKKIAMVALGILSIAYTVSFISFATYYFQDYKEDTYLIQLFNNPLYEPLTYLNNEVDPAIAGKTTYIGNLDQTYIYYLAATLTSPYDYNRLEIEDSEHLWKWTCTYKNFNFNLPEKIDLNANYIIQDKDTDYLELLEKNNFDMVQTGHYYVCTSPWESYQTDNTRLAYTWNSGITADNIWDTSIVSDIQGTPSNVIVGWAFDSSTNTCWDDTFLIVGNRTYRPEIVERDDVIETNAGNEDLRNSGMLFIIPQSELAGNDSARFVCIDSEGKIKADIPIQIK